MVMELGDSSNGSMSTHQVNIQTQLKNSIDIRQFGVHDIRTASRKHRSKHSGCKEHESRVDSQYTVNETQQNQNLSAENQTS